MKTRLTVIVDNIPSEGLGGEWGLSLLAEFEGKKILADVGGSALFAQNLKVLGFDIEDIDYATLSHAHYDHAGGMREFFAGNSKAYFYLRDAALENCYKKVYFFKKYIGIPKHVLRDHPDRIKKVSGDYKLFDGAYLIPHKTPGLDRIGQREKMLQKTAGGWKDDDFSHEQSLVLDTDKGLVIINCCCHGGVVNIINETAQAFPDRKIYGIVGGFHLFNKTEEEVREVARAIAETGIGFVCTGHCTKEHAYYIMKDELGDRLSLMHVGMTMEF